MPEGFARGVVALSRNQDAADEGSVAHRLEPISSLLLVSRRAFNTFVRPFD